MKLRTLNRARVEKENASEQYAAGRHNPGLVVFFTYKHRAYRLPISAGYMDEVTVLTDGIDFYIVSSNYGLDYVGLEVFNGTGKPVGDCFLQIDYELKDVLGPKGVELEPFNIAKRLEPYAVQ